MFFMSRACGRPQEVGVSLMWTHGAMGVRGEKPDFLVDIINGGPLSTSQRPPSFDVKGIQIWIKHNGAWWPIGRFVAFRPKGCRFESHSSCHVEILGKSFTHNCWWRFGVKL